MKKLVEFPLDDGTVVLVEVDEPEPEAGLVQAGLVFGDVKQTFEEGLDKTKSLAGKIIAKFRGLHDSPDEIELEFGLKLSTEVGVFLASAGMEANYTVTLTWKKDKKKEDED
jgi:hypothetical protein